MKFQSLTICVFAIALSFVSLGYADQELISQQMQMSRAAAQMKAIEEMNQLSSYERADLLRSSEQNVVNFQAELQAEKARLAAVISKMRKEQVQHGLYKVTGITRWVFTVSGLGGALWMAVNTGPDLNIGGTSTGNKAGMALGKKIFWTSASLAAVSYLTRAYLSTEVEINLEQLNRFSKRIEEIQILSNRESEVIQLLKKFYRVDLVQTQN